MTERDFSMMPPPPLHPYLGPPAHLSLSWLSQSFLALLLLFVSLCALLSSIGNLVTDAKESFTSACTAVQSAGDVMVSLPHFMADGVNELNKKSVDAITGGAADVLDLGLEALEAVVIFMIDTYQSLYLCLIDLAVHGSLELVIAGLTDAEDFVTSAFQGVRNELQDAVNTINSGFDDTLGILTKFGVDIPQIPVPTLTSLENVTIPSTLVDALTALNTTIPSLTELRSSLDSLISTPIEDLRAQINSTLSNATIDIAQLPVPATRTIDLCSDIDTSFIDDIGHDMAKFVKIDLGLLGVAAALLILANAFWERWRYKCYLDGVERARSAWQMDLGDHASLKDSLSTENLLAFLGAAENPRLAMILARLGAFFRLSPERRASLHWFGAYIFHPMAWIFLLLGVAGLVIVQVELVLLEGPVKRMMHDKANAGAGDLSTQVLRAVNADMLITSQTFANSSNAIISSLQNGLNDNLFGWVNVTTAAMNGTLNSFYDGITNAISGFFNNTPLQDPALDLVFCLIGSKVVGIEKTLTFIHNNAHVTLPTISDAVLMLSPERTTELTSTLTSPNSTFSSTSITEKMIERYAQSLRQQRLGYFVCIGIWVLVVLMGLFGVFWRHRGQRTQTRRQRRSPSLSYPLEKLKHSPSSSDDLELRSTESPFHRARNDDPQLSARRYYPSWKLSHRLQNFRPSRAAAASTDATRLGSFNLPSFSGLTNFRNPSNPSFRAERRRHSDLVDLKSGAYLQRSIPGQGADSRFRTVGRKFGEALRRPRGAKGLERSGSITSFGEREPREWVDLPGDANPFADTPQAPPPLTAIGANRPYLDYLISAYPPSLPVQSPLSPPPNGVTPQPPQLSLYSFPPLVPDTPKRQPSTYHPSSRPRNPFATPLDSPDDTERF